VWIIWRKIWRLNICKYKTSILNKISKIYWVFWWRIKYQISVGSQLKLNSGLCLAKPKWKFFFNICCSCFGRSKNSSKLIRNFWNFFKIVLNHYKTKKLSGITINNPKILTSNFIVWQIILNSNSYNWNKKSFKPEMFILRNPPNHLFSKTSLKAWIIKINEIHNFNLKINKK